MSWFLPFEITRLVASIDLMTPVVAWVAGVAVLGAADFAAEGGFAWLEPWPARAMAGTARSIPEKIAVVARVRMCIVSFLLIGRYAHERVMSRALTLVNEEDVPES